MNQKNEFTEKACIFSVLHNWELYKQVGRKMYGKGI